MKKHTQYLENMLYVNTTPSIRIINTKKSLKRYKFIGKMEANVIDYFI